MVKTKGHIITDEQLDEYQSLLKSKKERTVLVEMADYSSDHWYSISKFCVNMYSVDNNEDLDALHQRLYKHEQNVFKIIAEANKREPDIVLEWKRKKNNLAMEITKLKEQRSSIIESNNIFVLIKEWYNNRKQ